MSRDLSPPACPRTDAVLAIHLDGDIHPADADSSGFEFVCGDSLHTHLRECAACQQQLQRARRLDAVLAAGSGRAAADDEAMAAMAERWFAAVAEPAARAQIAIATEAGPTAAAAPRSVWRLPAALVSFAGALFAALLMMRSDGEANGALPADGHTPDGIAPAAAAGQSTPTAAEEPTHIDPSAILIATDAVRRQAQRDRLSAPRATPRAPSPADLRQRCEDDAAAPADRLAAARALLLLVRSPANDGSEAADELVNALVGLGDRTAGSHLLVRSVFDAVRGEPRFITHLQRRLLPLDGRRTSGDAAADGDVHDLTELAALTVAARLGVRTVDTLILRALRRQPGLGDPLASALRSGVRDAGGALLLLDAWQELAARGTCGIDEFAGQFWFAGQPAAAFDEVVQELRTTGSAPRRVHCLLALGFWPDENAVPVLLERVRKAPHLEAHAAAFALSRQPRRLLQPLLERATHSDEAFLLRAALARAALPETTNWVAALSLGPAERAQLRAGSFRDFPQVARWFRDRPAETSD